MLKFIATFAVLGGLLASYPANATTITFSTALPAGHQTESVTVAGLPFLAGMFPRPTTPYGHSTE